MMLGTVRPTRHRSAARVSRGLPARTSDRWGCDERWEGGCKDAGENAHRSRGSVGHVLTRKTARMAVHVTADTLLERVKAMAPLHRAYAAEAEARRRLACPVVDV